MIQYLREIPSAPKPVGAYSMAVRANGFVFCAGQIGIDPATGAMVTGGLEKELPQVLANLRAVLKGAGSSPEQIVATSVFLANISDSKRVNEVYSEFVSPEALPARQTFAVKDLPLGAQVEISVIAVYKD